MLTGVAVQEDLEGSDERHEQGAGFVPAEAFEGADELPRQHQGVAPCLEAQGRAPRAVRGELERRPGVAKLLSPVHELLHQLGMAPPLALPGGKVSILDGQVRQRGGSTRAAGVVQLSQLVGEHAKRPAIGDDVVHGHEQDVRVFAEPQQTRSQEGPMLQIEGLKGLFRHEPLG